VHDGFAVLRVIVTGHYGRDYMKEEAINFLTM
jgi:hypothetical protein